MSNNNNSYNTTNSYNNVWNNCTVADSQSQILAWLSPLEPNKRHHDVRDRRVKDVGEWIFQTEEFGTWHVGSGGVESGHEVLFCYGDPGVGKTYISSLVIDRLCDQARGKNVAVTCFYFDFVVQREQSSTSMLGALLKQIVGGLKEVPEEISLAYEDQKRVIGGRRPQLADVVKMMQIASSKMLTFICIDAVDECAAEHRAKLLDSLDQILQKSPGTRIFMTGRPYIQSEVGERLSGRVVSIAITPRRGDVVAYLRTRLKEDTNPGAMGSSLEADILRKILEDISGIFLLVSMNIDAILRETTIYRRRQKLNTMTDGLGLGGAYGAALDRIKGQDEEKSMLGMATLMWVSHAERPLKPDELLHALAIDVGSPNLNSDNIPSIGILLSCCQGLVEIDKEASTVRLIHFTLQEYLRAHPQLFGTAHSTMAEMCLSYLNSRQVKAFSTTPSPDLQSTPFLEYSSLYWGIHAKKKLSNCAKQLALKLFDDYNNHISAEILFKVQAVYSSRASSNIFCSFEVDFNNISLFSGLHCASVFGIEEIVASFLEVESCDIDREDCIGNTPLAWAALNGHEEVVKILLERSDSNPEKMGKCGQLPLCYAASNGHQGVVKLLLGRDDVNPDKPDKYGQTPLCWAAENGREGVVKILLGRDDVNPDKPGQYGQTPLRWAALNGHEGVVKILLGRDHVNHNELDLLGQTPLD